MGKPKPPAPPDYAAAAVAQGKANVDSSLASNYLNQANQVGPNGSLTYSYDKNQGHTLSDGTFIPQTTATTTLSPDQQKLYDQNSQISTNLNDTALKGISYVNEAATHPPNADNLPGMGHVTNPSQFQGQRDQITNAMLARLKPQMDEQQTAFDAKMANQGVQAGSQAYDNANRNLQQGFNDQRTSALLGGDQEQQNLFNNGLAGAGFNNQSRTQALQEQNYYTNQPLNMLNALRTGNQVNLPQFGNVAGGSQIQAAPIFQGAQAQYNAALENYKAQSAASGGILGGLASLGGAAITRFSDRRLKENIRLIGKLASGLKLYFYNYRGAKKCEIGVMADEVEKLFPRAVLMHESGYNMVDYSRIQ